MAFDRFSDVAADYAAFRPQYPEVLIDTIVDYAGSPRRAWDCATGSGQLAYRLAERGISVFATDLSERQLAAATPHERIHYQLGTAEACPAGDDRFDLVTVGQAAHWFDLRAFYREARRVLRTGGTVALCGYGVPDLEPPFERVFRRYYNEVVAPYWDFDRTHVDDGYARLPFPFASTQAHWFHHEEEWTFEGLIGYLGTWSALGNLRRARNGGSATGAERDRGSADPLDELVADLTAAAGQRPERIRVSIPFFLRLGVA